MPTSTPTLAGPVVPALAPVSVEILADLGSKISKTGDLFPIRLAAPLLVDGVEIVPAGTPGMGEVVHAKGSGGMGAAGELVLAARYLEVDGRHLRLRSLKLNPAGRSAINTVNTLAVASAATPLPLAFVGFFIKGGQVLVSQGSIADAKTAEVFVLSAPRAAVTPPAAPDPTIAANNSQGTEDVVQ